MRSTLVVHISIDIRLAEAPLDEPPRVAYARVVKPPIDGSWSPKAGRTIFLPRHSNPAIAQYGNSLGVPTSPNATRMSCVSETMDRAAVEDVDGTIEPEATTPIDVAPPRPQKPVIQPKPLTPELQRRDIASGGG